MHIASNTINFSRKLIIFPRLINLGYTLINLLLCLDVVASELFEVTSSGMTHSCESQWGRICLFILRTFAPSYRVSKGNITGYEFIGSS